jgi:hypothetical protein
MNEIVPDRKGQLGRSIAQRKRMRELVAKVCASNGGPDELIAAASALRSAVGNQRFEASRRLRDVVDRAEAAVAVHKTFLRDLQAAAVPAMPADIAVEIAELMLAFPGNVDLTAFMELANDDVASENPTLLGLLVACRELRRTSRFRPSIAEILEVLQHARETLRHVPSMVAVTDNLTKLKAAIPAREQAEKEARERHEREQAEQRLQRLEYRPTRIPETEEEPEWD